jgi:TolC family type I secretion outer membrane protein
MLAGIGKRAAGAIVAMATAAMLACPVSAQTLDESLAQAYLSNPTLLAARAELRSVDETIAQALSGYRPTLEASGELAYAREQSDISSWHTTHPNNVALTLTQPLYTGGRTEASTSQADNLIYAQREFLTATEQDVMLSVVTVYIDVILAEAVLELSRNNEDRLQRQLQATEDRFRVGEVTRTDVSQAKASLASAVADRLAAEGALASARADFESIVGSPAGELTNPGPVTGLPTTSESALDIAEVEHPTIRGAQYSELAAIDNVDVEFSDVLPQVSVVGLLSRNYDVSIGLDRQDTAAVLAQVTVPLYQAGFQSSQIRQAKQLVAQARDQIDEARRQVLSSVITAWEQLTTAQAQITAFQEQVSANEVALEGTQREAEVGERTVLDILDAEQALFESQISLVTAQRDEVVASYGLQSAMGRLTAAYLGLPVQLYDVDTYYREARDSWWGWGGLEADE